MAGSPTFSTEAADTLVTAYLAQPEGNRDLRRVLAAAKAIATHADPTTLNEHGPALTATDPSLVAEIAAMSKSQAYELLKADDRYTGPTLDESEQLALERAQREIEYQASLTKPDLKRLRDAHKIVTQSQWKNAALKGRQAHTPDANGLSSLLGT